MDAPTSSKSQSRPRMKPTNSSASGSLHLSALPRFHPAAYSASSSKTTSPSPASSVASPNPGSQLSPKASYRFFDPSQRQQLSYYHQHLLQASLGGQATSSSTGKKPASPKLVPTACSPGPVTPLELADVTDGYFSAGRKSPLTAEALMREEKKRLSDMSPRATTA